MLHLLSNSATKLIQSPQTKRVSDIILASMALILSYPLRKIIEHQIKKEDGGDVYYPQIRLGKNGQEFKMWKYRSMKNVEGAENDPSQDAQRKTRFGRFIRAKGFDEIPQFWNVLYGDMSMVGPRPRMIKEIEKIPEDQRKIILSVPQGIFGPYQNAQIYRPGEVTAESTIKREVEFAQGAPSIRRAFLYVGGGLMVALRGKEDHKPFATPQNDISPRP